jgi:sec-independent protein translocase protein TatC
LHAKKRTVANNSNKDMSFLDHLEELRGHLIRSIIAILVISVVAFANKDIIFGMIVLGPSKVDFLSYRALCWIEQEWNISGLCINKLDFVLQSRTMAGQFVMHITSSLICGLIIAFPYVFWELWRFIKPGLYQKESNAASGLVWFVSILFTIGVLFGYFVVAPLSINFLANYKLDPSITNQFDITSYVSTLIFLVLGCGLVFQLPLVMLLLAKAGIVSSYFLRQYRKHAFVVILIVAAFITPSPDILSQLLLAVPMYLLYEFSILLVSREEKKSVL